LDGLFVRIRAWTSTNDPNKIFWVRKDGKFAVLTSQKIEILQSVYGQQKIQRSKKGKPKKRICAVPDWFQIEIKTHDLVLRKRHCAALQIRNAALVSFFAVS
jgi:hypothetical protein